MRAIARVLGHPAAVAVGVANVAAAQAAESQILAQDVPPRSSGTGTLRLDGEPASVLALEGAAPPCSQFHETRGGTR